MPHLPLVFVSCIVDDNDTRSCIIVLVTTFADPSSFTLSTFVFNVPGAIRYLAVPVPSIGKVLQVVHTTIENGLFHRFVTSIFVLYIFVSKIWSLSCHIIIYTIDESVKFYFSLYHVDFAIIAKGTHRRSGDIGTNIIHIFRGGLNVLLLFVISTSIVVQYTLGRSFSLHRSCHCRVMCFPSMGHERHATVHWYDTVPSSVVAQKNGTYMGRSVYILNNNNSIVENSQILTRVNRWGWVWPPPRASAPPFPIICRQFSEGTKNKTVRCGHTHGGDDEGLLPFEESLGFQERKDHTSSRGTKFVSPGTVHRDRKGGTSTNIITDLVLVVLACGSG